MKFRTRSTVVEATQWYVNGDHPEDACVRALHAAGVRLFLTEGRVVRYFRRPDVDGHALCLHCFRKFHDHGWIDQPGVGHIVCPGDWVITLEEAGTRYPCKPDLFETLYERVA